MMRKWLEELAQDEAAMKRIEHLLDQTLSNDSGMVFPAISDAAEVFVIVWMAYTAGSEYLSELLDVAVENGVPGCTIGRVELGQVFIDEERDEFRFTSKGVDKPTDLMIEAD